MRACVRACVRVHTRTHPLRWLQQLVANDREIEKAIRIQQALNLVSQYKDRGRDLRELMAALRNVSAVRTCAHSVAHTDGPAVRRTSSRGRRRRGSWRTSAA